MPLSDPVAILVRQNHWANVNMLEACRELSSDQFHQQFEMGLGSLHDTIVHVIGAMRGWGDLLAGREQRPRLEGGPSRKVDELVDLHAEISEELKHNALHHPLDEVLSGERAGRPYSFSRGAVITHVTTHGMHHRAQCLNMLRQLGVKPLPASAVVEWVMIEKPG